MSTSILEIVVDGTGNFACALISFLFGYIPAGPQRKDGDNDVLITSVDDSHVVAGVPDFTGLVSDRRAFGQVARNAVIELLELQDLEHVMAGLFAGGFG